IACLIFSSIKSSGISTKDNNETQNTSLIPNEIVFYSNGSEFAPVIVLQGNAEVLWTWDDNTTTNSISPVKNYGSRKLRKNTLNVIPWSAVRRINIGYDAQDGGSREIELVENQYVSQVENLNLVAPYLKEWCSSYNMITSLDFNNFVNLETIECFLSQSLQSVNLTNTPKLKRVCFVVNSLLNLDLTGCTGMEEILVGSNKITDLILPKSAKNIWYIGARENHEITNNYIVNDLSRFPQIAHLSIWESNQKGDIIMPKTHPSKWVWIRAYGNEYTSIDFRGALQKIDGIGLVDMHNNKLIKVEIGGCKQIRTLDLSQNQLSSETVDYVLKQLDEFGPDVIERNVNLSSNQPPTKQGLIYKASLEAKGWNVIVDYPLFVENINEESFKIYPNPSNGMFHIHTDLMPSDCITIEIRNAAGQKLTEQKINDFDTEWFVNQHLGKLFFVTLISKNSQSTKKIVIN
ncbi:MAG TPA: T9SS type A sorting domain-containing protein, partial [Prolixibacteraceae bacterium]|nr:T9SS type A sorting domain-containing protein [Prolixibacteraceae bacterium]